MENNNKKNNKKTRKKNAKTFNVDMSKELDDLIAKIDDDRKTFNVDISEELDESTLHDLIKNKEFDTIMEYVKLKHHPLPDSAICLLIKNKETEFLTNLNYYNGPQLNNDIICDLANKQQLDSIVYCAQTFEDNMFVRIDTITMYAVLMGINQFELAKKFEPSHPGPRVVIDQLITLRLFDILKSYLSPKNSLTIDQLEKICDNKGYDLIQYFIERGLPINVASCFNDDSYRFEYVDASPIIERVPLELTELLYRYLVIFRDHVFDCYLSDNELCAFIERGRYNLVEDQINKIGSNVSEKVLISLIENYDFNKIKHLLDGRKLSNNIVNSLIEKDYLDYVDNAINNNLTQRLYADILLKLFHKKRADLVTKYINDHQYKLTEELFYELVYTNIDFVKVYAKNNENLSPYQEFLVAYKNI